MKVKNAFRPGFEALEDRRLMTAGVLSPLPSRSLLADVPPAVVGPALPGQAAASRVAIDMGAALAPAPLSSALAAPQKQAGSLFILPIHFNFDLKGRLGASLENAIKSVLPEFSVWGVKLTRDVNVNFMTADDAGKFDGKVSIAYHLTVGWGWFSHTFDLNASVSWSMNFRNPTASSITIQVGPFSVSSGTLGTLAGWATGKILHLRDSVLPWVHQVQGDIERIVHWG